MTGKRKQPERALRGAVVDLLTLYGFTVWEGLNGLPGEVMALIRAREREQGRRIPVVWQTPGIPDLICFRGTPTGPLILFLELKAGQGRLSPDQQVRLRELEGAGLGWAVIRDVREVMSLLKRFRVNAGVSGWTGNTAPLPLPPAPSQTPPPPPDPVPPGKALGRSAKPHRSKGKAKGRGRV